jgi:hypothetical protein
MDENKMVERGRQIDTNEVQEQSTGLKEDQSNVEMRGQGVSRRTFLKLGAAAAALAAAERIGLVRVEAQEGEGYIVTRLPDVDMSEAELASANDTDGVIEMEANSPLSRLAIGLQERVNEANSGGTERAALNVFLVGDSAPAALARARGTALPYMEIKSDQTRAGDWVLREGSIVFPRQVDAYGEIEYGYMEPVEVQGYGLTRPLLTPVTSDLRRYFQDLGLRSPSVGDWVAMTVIDRGDSVIPVSLAVTNQAGEPMAVVISFGANQEAPATPIPTLAPVMGEVVLIAEPAVEYQVDPTGEIMETMPRKWDEVEIVNNGARMGIPNGEVPAGVYNDPINNGFYVVGRFERVYRGGNLEDDGDVWYGELEVNNRTITIILGLETEVIGISDLSGWSEEYGGSPGVAINQRAANFPTLQVVEYLQQNPGIPVMLEYWNDMDEQFERARNSDAYGGDERLRRVLEVYDQSDTINFLNDVVSDGQYNGLGGVVIFSGLTWMP